MFTKNLSIVYGLSPGHILPFLQVPGKTDHDILTVAVKTRCVFPDSKTISTYRSLSIDPISDFISGQVDGEYRMTLGEFKFHNPDEYADDD